MRSATPRERCRQPESNRRPRLERPRCLTALHHGGVAGSRDARGPRLRKSRVPRPRPCCRTSGEGVEPSWARGPTGSPARRLSVRPAGRSPRSTTRPEHDKKAAGRGEDADPPENGAADPSRGSAETGAAPDGPERIRTPLPLCKRGVLPLHHGPARPAEESNLHERRAPTRTLPLVSSLAPFRSASRTGRKVQVPAVSPVLFWQHFTTRPRGTCSRGG